MTIYLYCSIMIERVMAFHLEFTNKLVPLRSSSHSHQCSVMVVEVKAIHLQYMCRIRVAGVTDTHKFSDYYTKDLFHVID